MDANKNRTPVVQGGNTSDGQYTRLARYSTRSASRQSNNRLHQQLTCGEGVGLASACVNPDQHQSCKYDSERDETRYLCLGYSEVSDS
jgi:hypothetical protein